MWKTRITEMLGIQYPIIQGAYAGFGTSAIAGPVSKAGGLGIITASALRTPEKLKEDIAKARAMTDKPIGVNLSPHNVNDIDAIVDTIISEQIKVVETIGTNAAAYGKRFKDAGIVWIHKVATVKHAISAEKSGADAVVIVGIEGAGSKSPVQVTTLINIPMAVRLIKIPVIAAGGIGDARGFMAALAMGAEAVYLGSAFMMTKECPISDRYKQRMVDSSAFDTELRERVFAPPGSQADKPDADENGMRISGYSLAVSVIDKVVSAQELIENIITGAEEIRQHWALIRE